MRREGCGAGNSDGQGPAIVRVKANEQVWGAAPRAHADGTQRLRVEGELQLGCRVGRCRIDDDGEALSVTTCVEPGADADVGPLHCRERRCWYRALTRPVAATVTHEDGVEVLLHVS